MSKLIKVDLQPFTPSTVLDYKIHVVKQIHMSCGGGMGGSSWYEYTKDDFNLNDKFIEVFTNHSGKKKSVLNTAHIVDVKDVRIVRIKLRNDGNEHMAIPVHDVGDYCYVFDNNDDEIYFTDRNSFETRDHMMRGDSRFLDEVEE